MPTLPIITFLTDYCFNYCNYCNYQSNRTRWLLHVQYPIMLCKLSLTKQVGVGNSQIRPLYGNTMTMYML